FAYSASGTLHRINGESSSEPGLRALEPSEQQQATHASIRGICMPLIVILDDQVTNRTIFSKLAASIDEGVVVRAFGEPQAALDWVRDNTPDLVVTDFKMPQMDGAEFIRRFRELPGAAEIPVIEIGRASCRERVERSGVAG